MGFRLLRFSKLPKDVELLLAVYFLNNGKLN